MAPSVTTPRTLFVAAVTLTALLATQAVRAEAEDEADDPTRAPVGTVVEQTTEAAKTKDETLTATTTESVPANETASLDLDALETRVRDTDAIGFFTKVQLKGEIDELVDALERYHDDSSSEPLEALKERYDLLLLKLLALLQDDDPALHADIADARSDIWALLSDPARFREARA